MDPHAPFIDGESDETGARTGKRPLLAGVEVREEDLEAQTGLSIAATVFRVSAAIILALAVWQVLAWWMDPPPGGAGMGVLVGDTIRLVVFAGLLWAAGDLAGIVIKAHYDIRASRILLARQTYMMRQIWTESGQLPAVEPEGYRRASDPDDVLESTGSNP